MLPSRSGILAEAISIASTSLKQRQSTSFALFLQRSYLRNSRPELFCKKGCPKPATLLKKRPWHKYFPGNFAKFLRILFFTEHIQWLLLAFAPIVISCFNTLVFYEIYRYLKLGYVQFHSMVENGGAKDFVFTCIFLRII